MSNIVNTINSNIGEINSDTMDKIQENTNEEEKILSDNSDIENTKEVPSSSLMYISFIIFITVLYVAKYFLPKFDYILTIIGAFILTYLTTIPVELTTIFLFSSGVFLHLLFDIDTNTSKFIKKILKFIKNYLS